MGQSNAIIFLSQASNSYKIIDVGSGYLCFLVSICMDLQALNRMASLMACKLYCVFGLIISLFQDSIFVENYGMRQSNAIFSLSHVSNSYKIIDVGSGYPCFVVSICMIGVCTAVIGDVAGHLGCFIYLKDSVNAIAFVALGTSVPGNTTTSMYSLEGSITQLLFIFI